MNSLPLSLRMWVGQAPFLGQPFHDVDAVLRGQFAGHMEREAFPAVFVEDRQDA